MLPDIQPGNTKILYFFNCLLDGMHTIFSSSFFKFVMQSGKKFLKRLFNSYTLQEFKLVFPN